MLSHRNSYSAGSASAVYGFRSGPTSQPVRASAAPVREGHSAEYEVKRYILPPRTDVRRLGRFTL